MKKSFPYIFYVIPFILYLIPFFLPSCQKEVNLDLPALKNKIVVDGRIEQGMPPYVILTNNMSYFDSTDLNSIQNMFIHGAVINVSDGTNSVALTEYSSKSVSGPLLAAISAFTGIDTFTLHTFNYSIYTTLNTFIYGQVGKTYSLTIITDGKTLTSTSSIAQPVKLDSVWWKVAKDDTLGFIWSHLSEPAQSGNAYRWLAKNFKWDFSFRAPPGAAFDDKFINGQNLDFGYGYYTKGDTVAVKFCCIDQAAVNFFRQMDIVVNSQGNPFAAPSSIPTNIYPQNEALGIWCGYSSSGDTIVCK